MSRQRNLHSKEDQTEINISPMIDMVFILLIFFIVTTVFVDEVGINIDKPQPSTQKNPKESEEPVVFQVMANGQVLHKNREVSSAQVQSIVEEAISRNKDLPVILQVQRNARSGQMVQVVDFARLGRAQKVSVTTID